MCQNVGYKVINVQVFGRKNVKMLVFQVKMVDCLDKKNNCPSNNLTGNVLWAKKSQWKVIAFMFYTYRSSSRAIGAKALAPT